jgi:hypothetical protein
MVTEERTEKDFLSGGWEGLTTQLETNEEEVKMKPPFEALTLNRKWDVVF